MNSGFRVIFLCIGVYIWREKKRLQTRWHQAEGDSDERPWSNTAAADGAGVGMEDTATASVIPIGVHEPASDNTFNDTTITNLTAIRDGIWPNSLYYKSRPHPPPRCLPGCRSPRPSSRHGSPNSRDTASHPPPQPPPPLRQFHIISTAHRCLG